ncbi:MAG: hypothetical protein HN712_06200 [Gemmatimonadetes bacterium]|nr:hypothetical protein [Gemmatimonadota bacterium]MBT7859884.1 hypothetical protein [Gemmatimonadota bacterium]
MPKLTAKLCEPAGVERRCSPLTVGLPFARGRLRDPEHIVVRQTDGQLLPISVETRSTWPDGSVRWALLDTQVDIEAMAQAEIAISYGDDVQPAPTPASPLKATIRPDAIDIATGALHVRLATSGPRLFVSASKDRHEFLDLAEVEADLCAWDADDRAYAGIVDSAEVEEANPLRLVVLARGGFERDGHRLLSWIARVCFFAHSDSIRVYLTLVHDQDLAEIYMRRATLCLPLGLNGSAQATAGSPSGLWQLDAAVPVDEDAPLSLTQWNVERHRLEHSNPVQSIDRRVNSTGWLQVADAERAITLKVRRPWQSYPKRWWTNGRQLGVDLYADLTPLTHDTTDGEPGRRWTEIDYEAHPAHDTPLRMPQGMARTHELHLRFAAPDASARQIDQWALSREMPLLLQLPSQYYADTNVFGAFQPFRESLWPLELKMRQFCRPPEGRGFVNDGDVVRLERNEEGRQQTRTTENLAYDLPRSMLRQYLRGGDQRLMWEAEASVMHLMDVDTVHHQSEHPEWIGGPYFEWSQNHHYADTNEAQLSGPHTSHTWLGSLLDFYFLTGYRRALEVAEMCADYCRRAAPYEWLETMTPQTRAAALDAETDQWPYSTRRVGWALTAMGTYYDAFPEERFLPAMESLVELLDLWQDEEGRWRDQIGSHNRGSTPFMLSSVLQGLQLFHAATGEERARRMLIEGALYLAHHGRTAEGIFYYKEAPVSNTPHASTVMLLPALAQVIEYTGDRHCLDAGYRLFRWLVDENGAATYMLKDLIAFMPVLEREGLLDRWSDTATIPGTETT